MRFFITPKSFFLFFLFVSLMGLSPDLHAKKRRIEIPQGMNGELAFCMELANKRKYEESVNCLEAFKSRYRGTAEAMEADLLVGDNYFRKKDYLLAAETYRIFIEENPSHPKVDYAYYRSGLSYYKQSPKRVDRDQHYLESSVQYLEKLVLYFPTSPYAKVGQEMYNTARLKQAKKEYMVARHYHKFGEYRAAIPRFAEVINRFPGLGLDEKSIYYVVIGYKRLGLKPQAQEAVELLEKRNPSSSWLKKARGAVS